MELTEETLEGFGRYMQNLMGLNHWNIKFTLCDNKEMYYENRGQGEYQGLATKHREILYACICINNESEYDPFTNWMHTVIHELVHLVMDDYDLWVEDQFEGELPEYGTILYEKVVEWNARCIYKALESNCSFICGETTSQEGFLDKLKTKGYNLADTILP